MISPRLNSLKLEEWGDPEIATRIAQYEMAYQMQTSVPELADTSDEPEHIFQLYGPDSKKPGSFTANCLLARRLAERGVRFVQLFHRGWDQHTELPKGIEQQCRDTDQASAALFGISSSGDSWKIRSWFGAASLAGRCIARAD